jgi:hypothetical protein
MKTIGLRLAEWWLHGRQVGGAKRIPVSHDLARVGKS